MKRKNIILLLTIVISSFLISCQDEVLTNYPEFDSKPVLTSFIIAGEPITAHISMATGFGESTPLFCDDATVSLFENDIFSCNMIIHEDGIYKTENIAKEDAKYTISAEVKDYKTVYGSTTIPPATDIYNFQHINIVGIDEEGHSYPGIRFSFHNAITQINYFDSRIYMWESEIISFLNPVYQSDSVLLNEGLPLSIFSTEIIRNAPEYEMQYNYTTGSFSHNSITGARTNLYPFVFEFRSLSKEFYEYSRQLYLYETGRYPEFGIGTNNSYPVYSNVTNGYGIVAGYSYCRTDTIRPTY